MPTKIVVNREDMEAILYNSVTGIAYGMVIRDRDGYGAGEVANKFLGYCDLPGSLASRNIFLREYGRFLTYF